MQTTLDTTTQSSGAGASTTPAAAAGGNGAPSQLFTTLLVAQIKNQNPLEPADPSQFVGQLTQLSQMEALQKLAAQGEAQAAMLGSLQQLALGAQVGATVSVRSDSVRLQDQPVSGRFVLDNATQQTAVVLTGADRQARRIELGPQPAGEVGFSIDPQMLGLPPGRYALQVDTGSGSGPEVEVSGILQNVKLSASGGSLLHIDAVGDVAANAITGLHGRP
ncbi:flagellar basal body rod modification protein [Aquabacterium sp. A7-Y]|uniref:flagellar hook capping FlgD N-terminal domain-containing protein n=1 Tax=Aquabacterium sp. A7-Y TaxID=1349605 RepID=UPI00223CEEE5|nr:flagellar hook capping FlgD N-terminal domain-containing protein [Aquabacterium sp. A7-Y]MCW7536537.1 flagellar basal body rod modification protein [Aquabacterium sp. A7-Y]